MKQFILGGLVLLLFFCVIILLLKFFWNFKERTLRPMDRFIFQIAFWASSVLFVINFFANIFSYPVVFGVLLTTKIPFDAIDSLVVFFLVLPTTLLIGSIVSGRFQSFRSGSARGSHGSIQTVNEHDSQWVKTAMKILICYLLITFIWTAIKIALSKSTDEQVVLGSLLFSSFMLVFGFWNLKSAYLILKGKDDASLGLLDAQEKKGGKK